MTNSKNQADSAGSALPRAAIGRFNDLKIALERDIKELNRQIKGARRAVTVALTLEERLAGQKLIKALEGQCNQKRCSLFDAQDEVDGQRSELIARIEGKLQQSELVQLFEIRWRIGKNKAGA